MARLSTTFLGLFLIGATCAGALSASACGDSRGALMLAISTDMKAPKDVNAVSITISANGVVKHSFIGRVTPQGEVLLPATLAIAEGDDPAPSIRIRVLAFQERRPRVLRDVRTSIPRGGRVSLLRIGLNFVNDGSTKSPDLPPGILPEPVGGAPSDPVAPRGELDYFTAFAPDCPDPATQTFIDGECKDSGIDPETLPVYDPSLVGDGADPSTCFDVGSCFADAIPAREAGGEGDGRGPILDRAACTLTFDAPPSAQLNIAFVTRDVGECIRPNECYVPIDRGPGGWTEVEGRVQLPPIACKILGGKALRIATSSTRCASKVEASALCALTAGTDGGPVGDAVSDIGRDGDATTTCGAPAQVCCASAPRCLGENVACIETTCRCNAGFGDCNTTAGDGCETALANNPAHCGRCGHDCGGGACAASECRGALLVAEGTGDGQAFSGTWQPTGFEPFDFIPYDGAGSALPSTNQGTGKLQIRAFSPTGVPGAFLTNELNGIFIRKGPWVTSNSVFWEDDETPPTVLRRVPRNGGAITDAHTFATAMASLRVDADAVYFVEGALYRIPPGSSTPQEVYASWPAGVFDVEGNAIFHIDLTGKLSEGNITGAPLVMRSANILPPSCPAQGLHVSAAAVYAFGPCALVPAQGYIVRFDRATSNTTTLLLGNTTVKEARWLVDDGASIYFSDNGGPYAVYQMPQAGGSLKLLASDGAYGNLSVSGAFLHAWRANTGVAPPGYVRLARP